MNHRGFKLVAKTFRYYYHIIFQNIKCFLIFILHTILDVMVLPEEFLKDSYDILFKHRSKRSNLIYLFILLFSITGLALLPFIHVDIYMSSEGIIRSELEKTALISPKSGYVKFSALKYNKRISPNDTLLIIDDRLIQMELDEVQQKLRLKQDSHSDLELLIHTTTPDQGALKTSVYQADLSKFQQQIQKIEIDLSAQKRILNRQEILYNEKVISEAQFDEFKYNLNRTKEELIQLRKNKMANWQAEKRIIEEELLSLQARNKALLSEKQQYVLLAEGSGTLMKVNELQVGTFVNQGTVLSELSPDSNLIVEAYITSSKMSHLKLGQEVNFQIHAFNYRNWGIASGKVFSISNDVEIINGQPVFKVLSSLKQESLRLSNGTEAKLKKGLTLTSKFIVAERSLFDLLYDKADDWLNPGQQSTKYQSAL